MIRQLLITSLAMLTSASVAEAQQWRAELQGGRIRSALDPSGNGTGNVVAGITYEDPTTALRVSSGIPTHDTLPYWGAIGAFKHLAVTKSGFTVGVDLSGNGYVFQDRTATEKTTRGLFDPLFGSPEKRSGNALAGQALPLIGFETGPVQLQARAGASYYTATLAGESRDRTVQLGDIQLTFQPTASFALAPVVRQFRPSNEKSSTFAGISGVVAQGRATLWANAGRWLNQSDTTSDGKNAWGVGGSLRLTNHASFNASARRDTFDPLYLNPPQTSWSVGMSLLIGGRPSTPRAPVPASYERGMATIRLPVSQVSSAPFIAGDFNRWTPTPMERDGKFWSYTVAAAPGVYNYAFVSSDGSWFVPENVPGRKDDGMGGHVAVLVVK